LETLRPVDGAGIRSGGPCARQSRTGPALEACPGQSRRDAPKELRYEVSSGCFFRIAIKQFAEHHAVRK
jgi:hypothetical protein